MLATGAARCTSWITIFSRLVLPDSTSGDHTIRYGDQRARSCRCVVTHQSPTASVASFDRKITYSASISASIVRCGARSGIAVGHGSISVGDHSSPARPSLLGLAPRFTCGRVPPPGAPSMSANSSRRRSYCGTLSLSITARIASSSTFSVARWSGSRFQPDGIVTLSSSALMAGLLRLRQTWAVCDRRCR